MIRTTRAGLGAALLLPAILAFAACGGGTAATPTPTPVGGVIEPSIEPGVSTEPGVSIDPGAIPSFDLGALTGGLPGVDSYRVSWSTGGVVSYESVVVTKPVLSKAITTFNSDGTVDTRYVIIDKEVWQAQGAKGDFEPVPEALATSMLMLFDPTVMFGAYANIAWGQAASDQGVEDKNGIQAHHLHIDPTSMVGLGASMPAGSAIDVWVADAGYLVAWEMSGFEGDSNMSIQITGVNDPANKVDRP